MLLLPIGYLIGKTTKIVSFFRTYVSHNYTTNIVNISGEHLNLLMYGSVLLILAVLLAVYYLMKKKKKTTKLYFFSILYYLGLFVLIGVTHSILSNMEHDLISAQLARGYRDVSLVLILPQYFFFALMFVRGIGFDIKKFNFATDIVDLEIKDVDSEEFLFELNVPSYKVERTIRRFIREFKYYVQENTFVFCCILAAVVIFLGTVTYLNFGVYNKTYTISESMTHNYFNMKVTDSLVTNIGYDGQEITNGKYYLAVQFLIENKTEYDYELDYTNFRLLINDQTIYPTLDRSDYFIDYGLAYKGEKIKRKTKNYYVLVYELNVTDVTDQYEIKIREGIDYKPGEITGRYKHIRLKPRKVETINEVEEIAIQKIGNFKDSAIGYTTFKINSYQLENSYTYSYQHCYKNGTCSELKDRITTDVSGTIEKTTLVILNMEYQLDSNTIYASNLKSDAKFFDHFIHVRYEKDGKSNLVTVRNRTTPLMKDVVVFEAKEEIKNADRLDLLVTIRDKRYVFRLK